MIMSSRKFIKALEKVETPSGVRFQYVAVEAVVVEPDEPIILNAGDTLEITKMRWTLD